MDDVRTLRMRLKLWLFLFFPVAGLAIYTGYLTQENYTASKQVERVEEYISLTKELSLLVHELQKERGASTGFVINDDSFSAILHKQYQMTAAEISTLEAHLAQLRYLPEEDRLRSAAERATIKISTLDGVREKVISEKLSPLEIFDHYSSMISALFSVIDTMPQISSNNQLNTQINAYLYFMRGKEKAGQERALGNTGFSDTGFNKELYERFIETHTAQDIFFDIFRSIGQGSDIVLFDQAIQDASFKTVERLREQTKTDWATDSVVTVGSDEWYLVATRKIDLLKQVEDQISLSLDEIATTLRTQYHNLFLLELVITAVLSLFAGSIIIFAYQSARRSEEEREGQALINSQLNAFIDKMPDCLLVVDTNGNIVRSNRAATKLLGYSDQEFSAINIDDLVPSADDMKHASLRDSFILAGAPKLMKQGRTIHAQHKTGRVIPVRVALDITETNKGPLVLVTCQDMAAIEEARTKLEKALEKAREANQAKTNFLAMISHELRTPLNAVIGFSDLLSQEIDALDVNPGTKLYPRHVVNAGNHLLDIVNDILDIAYMGLHEFSLEEKTLNLSELLLGVESAFHTQAIENDTTISVVVDKAVPSYIFSDGKRLKQLIYNLVGNAIKFTKNGDVTITVSSATLDDRHVKITVAITDTGIGIPEDKLSEIFEPFSQADTSNTRLYGGAGLGLAISKQIASLMQGRITVESTLGQGSTFTATFVAEDVSHLHREIQQDTLKALGIGDTQLNLNVLVVDDVVSNGLTVKSYLEPNGATVACASSGAEGIDFACQEKFDVILMDIHMPGMNGEDAAQKIRSLDTSLNRETPLFAFTADVLFTLGQDKNDFIDGVLYKPATQKDVFNLVKEFQRTDTQVI